MWWGEVSLYCNTASSRAAHTGRPVAEGGVCISGDEALPG